MQEMQTSLTAHRAALDGQKVEAERLRQQALEQQSAAQQQQLGSHHTLSPKNLATHQERKHK